MKKLEVELSNIIISGISAEITDDKIEPVVIKVLQQVNVPVSPRDIEASHRIGRDKKQTIVRFVNRMDAEAALSSRNKLKKLDFFFFMHFFSQVRNIPERIILISTTGLR